MRFRLLAIPFLVSLQFSGNAFAVTCHSLGTVGGTVISSSCTEASWSGPSNVEITSGTTISSSTTMAISALGPLARMTLGILQIMAR